MLRLCALIVSPTKTKLHRNDQTTVLLDTSDTKAAMPRDHVCIRTAKVEVRQPVRSIGRIGTLTIGWLSPDTRDTSPYVASYATHTGAQTSPECNCCSSDLSLEHATSIGCNREVTSNVTNGISDTKCKIGLSPPTVIL